MIYRPFRMRIFLLMSLMGASLPGHSSNLAKNTKICGSLLKKLYNKEDFSEEKAFQLFQKSDPSEFTLHAEREMVYRVQHEKTGISFFLRFEKHFSDLPRENFAAHFIRSAPGGLAPASHLLPVQQATRWRSYFLEHWEDYGDSMRSSKIMKNMSRGQNNISITVAYPGKSLIRYLRENSFQSPEDLDPRLLQRVSDHVSLYLLLGIPDPHAGNLLVHDGNVIGIDLEQLDIDLQKPINGPLSFRQTDFISPLAHFRKNPEAQTPEFFIRRISAETLDWIKNLSEGELKKTAEASRYDLKEDQIKAILLRRDALLELRERP